MQRYISEILGTYILVFIGCGAIVINDVSGGALTHFGVATAWGLVVTAVIYGFGSVSGAHINPAVTLGFWMSGDIGREAVPGYIVSQLVGSSAGAATLLLLFPTHETLGLTAPSGAVMQSFVLEIILTYILMLIILLVCRNESVKEYTALAVGVVVLMEALVAGPICGASMNPARSIGPAVVAGHLDHLWLYIAAPIMGAVLGTLTWKYLKS